MGIAVLHSRALSGMDAPEVVVEAHLANGLPSFTIVGLPEAEVKEARDRVRAAIQNARFEFPARRITTWHPPTCPRNPVASTCPSHSASSPPPGKFRRANSRTMNLPENWR